MSASRIWNVAVPAPLRRTFLYEVPQEIGDPVAGARVLVSFGRRKLAGYLLSESHSTQDPGFKIKKVESLLDDEPALPRELLAFLVEAADYYMHPIGEVLRSALPPGIDPLTSGGSVRSPRVKDRVHKVVTALMRAPDALDGMTRRAPKRAAVLAMIVESGPMALPRLRSVYSDASKHVRRLVQDEMVEVEERERPPDPFWLTSVDRDTPPTLTAQQDRAVASIVTAIDSGEYRGFLLQGITGSGKTEVYLRAIEETTSHGRGALVLVPEITLTPQLVNRYRARFGESLAVWHSGLTDRERFDQWKLLRTGAVKVAVGVRSAVFAPVEDLGIVVVDEEHDGSFKQERGFPYNARDLALLRAARAGAVAVLGSATPSMETFHNADIGKLTRLELTERPTRQPLPEIEIVDLTTHGFGPGGQKVISDPLHEELTRVLEQKEQAILFLNRRGFAPSLICSSCGNALRCDDCAVSLTFHSRPPGVMCHYCGARRPVPEACPSCGAPDLEPLGMGTQKVEELLAKLYPSARVARLDRDSAMGRGAQPVLELLRQGEIDILVGTQMVTKGHDFPRVTLVGVLLGDVGLHMPDFRAAERTFALLTQVAGRAGRSSLGGRALIQTYSPGHPAVAFARTHDYGSFAAYESENRKELGYPPFGRLAALRLSGHDGPKVEMAARDIFSNLRDAWRKIDRPPISMLGPVPAPIPYLQNRYRWRIMLRAKRQIQIRKLLSEVVSQIESPPTGVRIRLDIDPVSML